MSLLLTVYLRYKRQDDANTLQWRSEPPKRATEAENQHERAQRGGGSWRGRAPRRRGDAPDNTRSGARSRKRVVRRMTSHPPTNRAWARRRAGVRLTQAAFVYAQKARRTSALQVEK